METLQVLSKYYESYDEDNRLNSRRGMVEYLTTADRDMLTREIQTTHEDEISSDFAYLGPSTFFLCPGVLYPPVAESMGRRVREAQILVFALCSSME